MSFFSIRPLKTECNNLLPCLRDQIRVGESAALRHKIFFSDPIGANLNSLYYEKPSTKTRLIFLSINSLYDVGISGGSIETNSVLMKLEK